MERRRADFAVYLAATVVLLEIILFLSNRSKDSFPQFELLLRVLGTLYLLAGIWLRSNVARFCEAAFLAVTSAGAVSAFVTVNRIEWSKLVFWLIYAAVGATGVYVLVISRAFAAEFGQLREAQPRYQQILRKAFAGGAILLAFAGAVVSKNVG